MTPTEKVQVSKAEYPRILNEARIAGLEAVQKLQVTPMVVTSHESPMDDSSPVKQEWFVADGVCGFAWVTLRPANSAFANWLKKNHGEQWRVDSYTGGLKLWVSEFNQSMQRKEAYAYAFAGILQKYGFKASSDSRMD